MRYTNAYTLCTALIPPLAAGKSLWAEKPGTYEDLIMTAYPLGNGALGGMSVCGCDFRMLADRGRQRCR
jgi:hypothetical protein